MALLFAAVACGGDSPRAETGAVPPAGIETASSSPVSGSATSGKVPASSVPAADIVFQPDSAWTYLVRQVEFGPRVPGTPAQERCADWMAAFLESVGGRVERDRWTHTDSRGREWPLINILARFGPETGGRLLLVAHWDSRPWADLDPDPARREKPVPGANDGASGVAVLLEIARGLGQASIPRGVDILLVDGEDLGQGETSGFCQGSRRFARKGLSSYRRGIVLDMVGDADLRLPVEYYSVTRAPEVVDWVWGRALDLGSPVFTTAIGSAVYDDHMPLLDAGLPTVDVIDFEYPPWHTSGDGLNAVSPRSLHEVGRVILSLALDP